MRIFSYLSESGPAVGMRRNGTLWALDCPDLDTLISSGGDIARNVESAATTRQLDPAAIDYLPLLRHPPKIVCVGLNYADHAAESPYKDIPTYPTFFPRFAAGLIGHEKPMILPMVSEQLDFEAELAVVIGYRGRHIAREDALSHVLGYSLFNDGSLRDYQFKAPQWTAGKNFEGTGGFGPELVTPDELPEGASGLRIQTRLNGATVQDDTTANMIFKVVDLIHLLSEFISVEPGDVIVTGTPAGVGFGRRPPVWMKEGDLIEVEIEKIGVLRNRVTRETVITPGKAQAA
jgi:acylpyruvate hydrolase